MIVYNLPSTIKPRQVTYRAVSKQSLNKSAFTGHEVVYHYPDKHFEIMVDYPRMQEDVAREFEAVFMAMNNKTDVLKFYPSTGLDVFFSIGSFVSNNGNLYKIVNVTGAGDGDINGYNKSSAHLFPAKRANWSGSDIKNNANVFVYCSITEDFEWNYDLAVTTGISIPLREFIQTGTQTIESFDNIHEIVSNSFGGYYYYGNDGTNGEGYYHPLFLNETQSNAYTGGDGTSHSHSFDTAPGLVFYMPNNLTSGNYGHGATSISASVAKFLSRHYFSTDIVGYGSAQLSYLFGSPFRYKNFPTKLTTDDINAPVGGGY